MVLACCSRDICGGGHRADSAASGRRRPSAAGRPARRSAAACPPASRSAGSASGGTPPCRAAPRLRPRPADRTRPPPRRAAPPIRDRAAAAMSAAGPCAPSASRRRGLWLCWIVICGLVICGLGSWRLPGQSAGDSWANGFVHPRRRAGKVLPRPPWDFLPPEGAERRKAPLLSFGPSGRRVPRRTRRLPALHRGDFGPRDRSFRGRTAEPSLALIPEAFASVHPARVQPTEGRPHVVGADGDPGPPGDALARHIRGRRRPRSANRTPPEGALGERGWMEYRWYRNIVKDYFPIW